MKSNVVKYIFVIVVILIIIFAIFIGKKGEEENNNQNNVEVKDERIKEIKLGIAKLDTINPILSKNKNVQEIEKLIFEPLVTLSKDYKAEPALAKEWSRTSENTFLVKLRENVRWSNGKRFTSDDVKFTIERLKDTDSIYSANVRNVTGIEIMDDYMLQINLDSDIPFFEYNLIFPILSRQYYEGEDFVNSPKNQNPVGTGMFQIQEVKNSYIILDKNPYWWNKDMQITLERIVINLYSNLGELYNNFKLGNIDFIASNSPKLQEYIGNVGYNFKELNGREHTFITINHANEVLAYPEVRKAISYSLDKGKIVTEVLNNKYRVSSFPLDYGNWLVSDQNASVGFSIDQAKRTLMDARWKYSGGRWQKTENYKTKVLTANLMVRDNDQNKIKVAESIKEQLRQAGIIINIEKVPQDQYNARIAEKKYDMALSSIILSPSPNLETFLGVNNMANYKNDEVFNILNEVKKTKDEKVLKEKYQRLFEIYKNDVPYISLYNDKYTVAYSPSIVGELNPNWFYQFYGIEGWYK